MLRQLAHAAVQLMQAHTTLAYEQARVLSLDEYSRGYDDGTEDAVLCDDIAHEDD